MTPRRASADEICKGTGVFLPLLGREDILNHPPTSTTSSSSSNSSVSPPRCGLLSSRQHAVSAQWRPEALRGPVGVAQSARPGATTSKRQQPVPSCVATGPHAPAGPGNSASLLHSSTRPQQLQQRTKTTQSEACPAISSSLGHGQQAVHRTSTDSSSSSCCAGFAAEAGLWGAAASATAQPGQLPAGHNCQLTPATSDELAMSGVEVWLDDDQGCLPATMWFEVQRDSVQLQADSSAHSLSWASNDSLMMQPAPSLDASGLSPLARAWSSGAATTDARAAKPRRSSLPVLPPRSLGVPAFSGPASVPGSLFASPWAPPSASVASPAPPQPVSLLEQQLLLAQSASASGMAPGMSSLDPTAADLLLLPLGQQPLLPPAPPAEAAVLSPARHAALLAAAQSKLQQLEAIEELKQTLEHELLGLLRR